MAEWIEMPAFHFQGIIQYFGVALQFFLKLVEGAQALFCLIEETHVADEILISQCIVYMQYLDLVFLERFSP